MPEELALGIELVEHRIEVALVDAAAVEQDQRALRLARPARGSRWTMLDDLARAIAGGLLRLATRGLLIGRRTGSTCSRRCS